MDEHPEKDGREQPEPAERSALAMVAVGDLQLGDSPTAVGFGFRSRYDDPEAMRVWTAHVRELLGDADLVFGNLEGVISEAGMARDDWRSVQLRGRPFYARSVREAGFDVLNVANNHTFQHGTEAFAETVRLVEAEGITVAGLRGRPPWASRPAIVEIGGTRVGILAYCFRPRQYSPDTPPYAEGNAEAVCADVRRLKGDVEHVVVSLHWGEEFVPVPSVEEVRTAERIVEAGADTIVGHHPHVLRALHAIGDTAVAYSLGNFTGDMVWHEPLRTGGILRWALGEPAADARIEPVRVEDDYLPRPIAPPRHVVDDVRPLSADEYEAAIGRTISAQRLDVYRYAFRHIHRYPGKILLQLARTTVRNKLAGLLPQRS